MKSILVFTILSLITLQTLGVKEMEQDLYDPDQFVNHQLNDFMYNLDTDYSKFYQPLLKHLEKTLPYLQEVGQKLSGNYDYIKHYIKIGFSKESEYCEDRFDDALDWMEERVDYLEGNQDEEQFKEIIKILNDASEEYESINESYLKDYEKIEGLSDDEEDEEDNQEYTDREVKDINKINDDFKDSLKEDIEKRVENRDYIEKTKEAIKKLKLLMKKE